MNVEEYISSGILELYVSGLLSEAENKEVLAMAQKHPEIQSEIEAIEQTMIQFSERLGDSMSNNLKGNILKIADSTTAETTIIKDNKDSVIKSIAAWWRPLAVAASLLLLGSILGNIYFFSQLQNSNKRVIALENEKSVLVENSNIYKANYNKTTQQFEAIRTPGTRVVELQGQKIAPESKATVYWNPEKQTVFIDANQMPTPPPGKVYQLWSLKLDPLTPKDAGLLSAYKSNEDNFFQLKNVDKAEAFAITLEPEGGSVNPTLDQLYVIGNL